MLILHIFAAKSRSGNFSPSLTIVPRQNPSKKQKDSTFPCTSPELNSVRKFFISFEQGGYHELQNEPNGVKEKLLEEVVSFIDDLVASSILEEAQTDSEPLAPETTNPAVVAGLADDSAKAKM
jgi:hypothetical protein